VRPDADLRHREEAGISYFEYSTEHSLYIELGLRLRPKLRFQEPNTFHLSSSSSSAIFFVVSSPCSCIFQVFSLGHQKFIHILLAFVSQADNSVSVAVLFLIFGNLWHRPWCRLWRRRHSSANSGKFLVFQYSIDIILGYVKENLSI